MEFFTTYLGEMWALITAVVWAVAVVLFRLSGESVHPVGLNVFKNALGVALFIPTALIMGEPVFAPASTEDYLLLLFSGALGIGISDTLFFRSLNMLGAGMIAVIDCLYAPSIIFFSILWLNESLTLWQIIGVILIVSAVLTATGEGSQRPENKKTVLMGILFGVLAILTMTMGLVMIKPILDRSPLIWTTQMRMIGGLLSLMVILAFNPRRKAIIKSVFVRSHWWYTLMGSWLGGYASTIMWLAGMKFTQASVASALNQTSNIFIFLFAALFLRERITRFKLVGIILGMIGAVLVILA